MFANTDLIEAVANRRFTSLAHLQPVWDEQYDEPWFSTGKMGIVFKLTDAATGQRFALKVFKERDAEREERLRQIAQQIAAYPSPYWVSYQFLPDELMIDSLFAEEQTACVLLMEWIEGQTLGQVVRDACHRSDRATLYKLAYAFDQMALWLIANPFAHGDLKHDNIIVRPNGTPALVDYDGVFFPIFTDLQALELGTPDYQHPNRNEYHYGLYLDDFSLLVISLSLYALAHRPDLYAQYNTGENLILTYQDFVKSRQSPLLGLLQDQEAQEVRQRLALLDYGLLLPPQTLPGLEVLLRDKVNYYKTLQKITRSFTYEVNVDIGGVTTNIVLSMKQENRYLNTSFQFASYDIWGAGLDQQGHSSKMKDNGFVQNYLQYRRQSLSQPRSSEDQVFDTFLQNPDLTAEDIVSLLFKYDTHFKFTQSIQDGRPALRIVLYLHYSSIVYHLVQMIEVHNLSLPRYLTFVGHGSHYLNMLGSRTRLIQFTKLLFKAYTTLPIPPDFEIVLTDNLKETTANGAVLFEFDGSEKARNENRETTYYWGNELDKPVSFQYRLTQISDVIKQDDFHNSVLNNVKTFLEKTLKDPGIASFLSEYNIRRPEQYLDFLVGTDVTRNGRLYDSYMLARTGLERNADKFLAETYFFLPLKHALYELSKQIAQL